MVGGEAPLPTRPSSAPSATWKVSLKVEILLLGREHPQKGACLWGQWVVPSLGVEAW